MPKIILTLLIAAICVTGLYGDDGSADLASRLRSEWQQRRTRAIAPGATLPDLILVSATDGHTATLSDFARATRASRVLILFYDHDCDECQQLIAQLAAESSSLPPVIGIDINEEGSTAAAAAAISAIPGTIATVAADIDAVYDLIPIDFPPLAISAEVGEDGRLRVREKLRD